MPRNFTSDDRYRVVNTSFWRDPRIRAIGRIQPSAQGLLLFLMTGPHNRSSLPGLFAFWPDSAASVLSWSRSDVLDAMQELVASGLVRWSELDGVCWIPTIFEYEVPTSPSVAAAWAKEARTLPECALVADAIANVDQRLRESIHATAYGEWQRCLGVDGGGR